MGGSEESARGDNHKKRVLQLLRVFERFTDEKHRLTMEELLNYLSLSDNEAQRRNVRRDIQVLKESGVDIRRIKHRTYEYYLKNRHFRDEEIKVLIDVVQSSRSIDEETSRKFSETILELSSPTTTDILRAAIKPGNRAKTRNNSTFQNIEIIQTALISNPRHVIQFRYFELGFDLKRIYHYGGDLIEETPVLITYISDNYYLISYNRTKENIVTRRIDRMVDVLDTGKEGVDNQAIRSFNIDSFGREQFGMFIRKPQEISLLAKREAMNALYDWFGDSMQITQLNEDVARVIVNVAVSMQFIGWIIGMSRLIQVETDIGVDWNQINKALGVWME